MEIPLVELWDILKRRRLFISIITLAATLASAISAIMMTPIYRAEVLMSPVMEDNRSGGLSNLANQFGGLAVLAGVNLSSENNVEATLATFRSRKFTETFLRERELLPVLFSDRWDPKNHKWAVESQDQVPTIWDAYNYFDKNIRHISQDKKTGLVTLAVEWSSPGTAAIWANDLAARINDFLRRQAAQETERNIDYLRRQIQETNLVSIQQSLFNILESQLNKAMLANASNEYAFKIIDPAVAPREPAKPKKPLIVAAGFFLGLIISLSISLFSHLTREARENRMSQGVSTDTSDQ